MSDAVPRQIRCHATPARSVTPAQWWLALGALALANALWGASFFLGKIALTGFSPGQVVLGRFAIAIVVLSPALVGIARRVRAIDVPHFVLSGVLMVPVMMLVQVEGLRRTSATHAALIIGTIPVLMAVAAVVIDRERVGRVTWLAAAISTGGLVWMVWSAAGEAGGAHDALGDGLVLISAVAAVAWTVVTRRLLKRYPSVGVTAMSVTIGTIFLLPITLLWDGPPPIDAGREAWLAVLALGVACTAITYGLWNWGLRHVPMSRAGILVNLEPLIGAAAGVVLLGEPAGTGVILGGGAILVAAALAAVSVPAAAEQAGADAGALPDHVPGPAIT